MRWLRTAGGGVADETLWNARRLAPTVAAVVVLVGVFTLGFDLLMAREGREFSWVTGLYWTLVTMSTLGYGDIVFESDLGRMYSLVVLAVGALLMLALLPFLFIQFVYLPWSRALRRSRVPRHLARRVAGHVVLVGLGPVQNALAERLKSSGLPFVVLVEDVETGARLHDAGRPVVVGALDDPETYQRLRADAASLVFTAENDMRNTNIAYTVREVAGPHTVVVATATSDEAEEVLLLAGCDHALNLGATLGEHFANRILSPDPVSKIIATFGDLAIAEISAAGTALVGRRLGDILPAEAAVCVLGLWERGRLHQPSAQTRIEESSILLLAGARRELQSYDQQLAAVGQEHRDPSSDGMVLILGGGRVGRATARRLRRAGTASRIVEREHDRVSPDDADVVIGDAADGRVLEAAGLRDAHAVVVTTHDDDTNVFLTLYCRRLRPDVDIIGRVAEDRNLSTMHRAGADIALSYASTGAAAVWNIIRPGSTLLLAEGLAVFRLAIPEYMVGRRLSELRLPDDVSCRVVALLTPDGHQVDPQPTSRLRRATDLLLVGHPNAETQLLRQYPDPH